MKILTLRLENFRAIKDAARPCAGLCSSAWLKRKTERTATLPGKERPLHLLRQAAYSGGWRVQILRGVP